VFGGGAKKAIVGLHRYQTDQIVCDRLKIPEKTEQNPKKRNGKIPIKSGTS
jgi:hypothetical protein